MSEHTNPTEGPAADETPGTPGGTPADTDTDTDTGAEQAGPGDLGGDDGGAALERAQEAIDEAQDAQGTVAAHDDITSHDDAMAGEYSEDPGGEGGHP